ncbi:MAG: DUF1853 family protein [Halioglobus sp.]
MAKSTAIITMNEPCSAVNIRYPYKTQEVRDLAWACFSPPLLNLEQTGVSAPGIGTCVLPLTEPRQAWLAQLDQNAAPLITHLAQQPTHRLGIYFEQLWHFFLQQDPEVELVAHNLPIRHQGRTVGEFDCLYYCHRRKCHVHLELAVKYFLRLPRTKVSDIPSALSDWVGPDNRDRLDLKLEQLLKRQILLGDHCAAQHTLRDLNILNLTKEIALKGYLFQAPAPAPATAANAAGPRGYNADCRLNPWVPIDQVHRHCNGLDAMTYMILPKMKWLSPACCGHTADTMAKEALQAHSAEHFSRDSYPLMIAALDEAGNESSRFFLTPSTWPEINN